MAVGVGEAGGVAPAYSLISDYFPPRQRGRALAVFSFGIPLGMALGILLGGLIAARIDWRTAFIAVGGVGLLLGPILRLTVRDPKRGGWDAQPQAVAGAAPEVPGLGKVVATVFPKKSFWLLAFGAASSSVCGYGVAFWLPTFFQRSLGLSLEETAIYYGAIVFFGGVAGIWLGGALGDRFGGRSRGAYALVPALCFLVALPCFFMALNAPTLAIAFGLFLVPTGLNLAWLGPVITAVQHLAPASMRATASALFLLINNLVGIALGTYYFGWMSDLLKPWFGQESIRYAIYSGGAFYLVAATLLVLASRNLGHDWVD
jgi:MFS family permease